MIPPRPHALDLAIHRVDAHWRVELTHDDPSSQARGSTLRGETALAPGELLATQGDPAGYGRLLFEQVFADPRIRARFLQVEAAAQATDRPVRLSVTLDPSAAELHALRWELLRHPETDRMFSTSERILFSRFVVSDDLRPVQLRARTDLVALVAVSAPAGPSFQRAGLAAVDFAGEVERTRSALAGIEVRVVGGPGDPLTLQRLVDALRGGVDLLYLVSHGRFRRSTGTPLLFLQGEDGDAAPIDGEALTTRLADLAVGPRLVVLASCQSAGAGGAGVPDERVTAQATLAGRIADAGVPAVVAMQGDISMETVRSLMPTFFRELRVDGQIDRALAVARGRVRDRPDAWMPALFSRLRDGKLWYTAGFRGIDGADQAETWQDLLPYVRRGEILPILGPELASAVYGPPGEVARKLAEAHRFPLAAADRLDLPRVSQFIHVSKARGNLVRGHEEQLVTQILGLHPGLRREAGVVPRLLPLIDQAAATLRTQDPADPHRLLAALDAPIYVTTSFDPLMERALQAAGRTPRGMVGRWRYNQAPVPADPIPLDPTTDRPVVYHLFGALEIPDSMVLTEDDTFDCIMATTAGRLTPSRIEGALVASSLLILGFRLTDWSFRMLFRLLMSLEGKGQLKQFCHVAVQLDPELQTMADVEAAKAHLAKYFGSEANIKVYWGSARDFLAALHRELARQAPPAAAPTGPAGAGGWEDDLC